VQFHLISDTHAFCVDKSTNCLLQLVTWYLEPYADGRRGLKHLHGT